jgi:hypothetical protein
MRLAVSLLLLCSVAAAGATKRFFITAGEPAGWAPVLVSIGLEAAATRDAADVIVGAATKEEISAGRISIRTGATPDFGFAATAKQVAVRRVTDLRRPELFLVWEKALPLPIYQVPAEAKLFYREHHDKAPLSAGLRIGKGSLLWMATDPGPHGYERFPWLPQALTELGLETPARAADLHVFFDSSYRRRVDLDYFAERWRAAGISTLHVAAWHFQEARPADDEYLQKLITACHRNAIRVFAWLELPHVSEQMWNEHPEWREKTATLADAQLDWRKLMNLRDPNCARAVEQSVRALLDRFAWDGVNLAELYFESLEGAANPARFTPMNEIVRNEFRTQQGWDPMELWTTKRGEAKPLRAFLDYRAAMTQTLQEHWLNVLEDVRRSKPHLGLVLTHIDDRYEPGMRDLLGADTTRFLRQLKDRDMTFLIEDPATVWHLGPSRYPEIAARYKPLTARPDRLAIDINIVERYQDVYPTKQQTGSELFQLVNMSSRAFPQVALYFESSILGEDLDLLPASAAVVSGVREADGVLSATLARAGSLRFAGPVLVNGKAWPVTNGQWVHLPEGSHRVETAKHAPAMQVLDCNAVLLSARMEGAVAVLRYRSDSRAWAVLSQEPEGMKSTAVRNGWVVELPRGEQEVRFASRRPRS